MTAAKTVTMYGIKNCDRIRKARAWLDQRGVVYLFHDFKTQGIDDAHLRHWQSLVGFTEAAYTAIFG